MIKNPLISVIIPTRNSRLTLKECIGSILKQNYKCYEVIVIDNNSTDNTEKIIKELQKNNKKITYLFEKQIGRGAARNKGILFAKGEVIAMTDSDCIVPKNWLKEITKDIILKKEKVVMGFEYDLIKNFWTKNIQEFNERFIKERQKGNYISHIDTKNFAIEAKLMRKLMFDSSIKNFEDFDLYLRLKNIARIRYKPNIKVYHHHKNSFVNVVKINFNRAFWTYSIYQKYKKDSSIKNEPMFICLKPIGFIFFPFYIIKKFLEEPIGKAFFRLISETSWRIGIIYGMIKKHYYE